MEYSLLSGMLASEHITPIPHDSLNQQVEDTIFEVPWHRFAEHSAVFEGMFRIPHVGDAENIEGKSEGHPITLEGYQEADFRALIKVLYPAYAESLSLTVAVLTNGM